MDIIQKSLNYLKSLSAEIVSNAKSGHTGSSLGASSILFALFKDHLIFDPEDTNFLNRDRFILSAGHLSSLYYSLLHLFGYDLSMNDLKNFRVYGSKAPGHPERGVVPGVETTTGPLGQGIANAVGLAMAETMAEARFNTKSHPIFNNHIYCLTGDGCLMEGVAVEACSLAGTMKLNNLILLYDNNEITIEGERNIANLEDTALKFKAMGWNVLFVQKGNDYFECSKAIAKAKKSELPTIIIFKTKIGIGTKKEGHCSSHAMPMSADDLKEFKQSLGVSESFFIPDDVYEFCRQTVQKNKLVKANWNKLLEDYKLKFPEKYKELKAFLNPRKINFEAMCKKLDSEPEITGRDLFHKALNEFSAKFENLVGGTADLAPSTKAFIANSEYYSAQNRLGKNIHFGVREHSMGSIANGITIHSNFYAFDSTFMTFCNYMLPAIRMRAMMNLPVLSVFSHDSINIGQDGPTHQPIEQLGQLRQIIGLNVVRPATSAEMVFALKLFEESKSPVAVVISKSKLKKLPSSSLELAEHGAYVVFETKTKPNIEIFATGSEVGLAIDVASELEDFGARVISMPCESIFDKQDKTYKNKVRLKNAKLRVAIEASNDPIWYKYVGSDGLIFNVNSYQSSGNGTEVYEKAGFSKENILKTILKKLK